MIPQSFPAGEDPQAVETQTEPAGEGTLVSLADIARLLGVTYSQADAWRTRAYNNGFPQHVLENVRGRVGRPGPRWLLHEVMEWHKNYTPQPGRPRMATNNDPPRPLDDHAWPAPGECLWSPWYTNTPQRGLAKPTQYRQCLHPLCKGVQYRTAPAG